jgi:hypothetical protein
MSEVRAPDLVEGQVDSDEAHSREISVSGSREIRSANLGRANLAASGPLPYEIRPANLVKVILAQGEDDS